jgi:hypothetical protein
MDAKLARDVRMLKAYAAGTTVCLIVLLLTAFQSEGKQKFGEIDVERINIVEPDGRIDLVISNTTHFPPPIWKGKPMGERKDQNGPGMVFYNDEGSEDGGLVFSGVTQDGKYQAGAGLLFDQYDQDQIVGIDYGDSNGERTAGLYVWERPNTPLIDLVHKRQAILSMPAGPAKDAALKQFQEQGARGEFGGQSRVFVGKNEKNTSEVMLADTQGKPGSVLILRCSPITGGSRSRP